MISSLALLAITLTAQAKEDGNAWIETVSREGGFSFAMPARPLKKEADQKSPNGPLHVLEYSCTHDDCLYKVEQSSVPARMAEDKLEGALGAIRDSIAKKFRLRDDRSLTVSGWPACAFTIEAPLRPGQAPCTIAMLVCFADNHFYQVRVFSLTPGTSPRNVPKFFDGFKPKTKRTNTEVKATP